MAILRHRPLLDNFDLLIEDLNKSSTEYVTTKLDLGFIECTLLRLCVADLHTNMSLQTILVRPFLNLTG